MVDVRAWFAGERIRYSKRGSIVLGKTGADIVVCFAQAAKWELKGKVVLRVYRVT
jgi:hypothetical protein